MPSVEGITDGQKSTDVCLVGYIRRVAPITSDEHPVHPLVGERD